MARLSGEQPTFTAGVPRPDSIARNTGVAFVTSLASAGFTAVLTLFLLRALGLTQYGVFALAMSLAAPVLLVADLGISHAAARFVAEGRRDRVEVTGVTSDALRLKVVVAGLFSLAFAFGAVPIAEAYDTPALVWPIRILALAIFGESLLGLFRQLSEAEGRQKPYLGIVLIESTIETTVAIALVLGGFGAAGAIAGRAAGYLMAAGIAVTLLLRPLDTRRAFRGRGAGNVRRISRYGSAVLVVDGAFVLFGSIDALLIGAMISVTAVGQFQAPVRLMAFLTIAGTAVASGVAPRLARGREEPNKAALNNALRHLMILQGILIAPLVVWAEPITRLLLGADYAGSANVLRAFAPYAFLIAISPVITRGVTYLGAAHLRIPIAIGALLVNLVFDLVMLPRIGIVAGALGTDLAYGLYVAAHLMICRRFLGIPLRPLVLTLLRVMAAAMAMSVVLLAFGTGQIRLPALAGGAILASLTYVGTLLLTRAVAPGEVRRGLTLLSSLFPRVFSR